MKPASGSKSKCEVGVFFIVTILFTWFLWLPALLIHNFGLSLPLPYDLFVKVGSFVPSAAGFVLAYIFGGKTEIHSLIKSHLKVHIRAKWHLFIFVVLPGVSAVSCLIFSLSGSTIPQMQFAPWFIPVAFACILILMGPLGEEAGWRGFALKRLLWHYSPIGAALMIGVIWSIWHLPLFFINGTTQNAIVIFGIFPALFGYFVYTIMISVLITLLYIMTNGSVFGSILLHTVGNLSLGFIPLIFSKKGAIIVLLVLCITTTVFLFKYRKILIPKV